MRIKVEFYDILRELTGRHEWCADIQPGSTAAELFSLARRVFPSLEKFPCAPVFTSGLDYVESSHVIGEGETISILPPPPKA